jgi:energy-converting hydrogenase B subunit D
VLTRDPLHQAVVASFFGLLLGVAFLVLQAPDVALSQITAGAVALPLMILLALAKVQRQVASGSDRSDGEEGQTGDTPPEPTGRRR